MKIGLSGCVAAALVLHGALGFALARQPAPPPAMRILEVELSAVQPAASPPPPSPIAPPPTTTAMPTKSVVKTSAAAPAPAAAKAAPLLTVPDTTKTADEPVAFVTDPNGTTYGSGVVARGGSSDHGVIGATPASSGVAPTKARATLPSDAITPSSDLSRQPGLDEPDACRGFFPRGATSDAATVSVVVVVRPSGAVASVTVVGETPIGEGFGASARACLASKPFTPALDRHGDATMAAARFNVRFTR